MKIIILSVLCAVSLSVTAQKAQNKKSKKEDYMPLMTRGIGVSFVKFDGLKSRLATYPQYARLRDHVWTISAGSMHVMNNFVSQMTITAGAGSSGDWDKKSSSMRILGAGLDFGYDVIPSDMIMLYPMVGIGAETYHAILRKDASFVDFNDVANSPTVQNNIRSVKFTNSFFNYRLGLGLALKSPKGNGTIGIQGGYVASFNEQGWKSAEAQTLNGSPSDRVRRWAVSLVFTGGGMMGMGMAKK